MPRLHPLPANLNAAVTEPTQRRTPARIPTSPRQRTAVPAPWCMIAASTRGVLVARLAAGAGAAFLTVVISAMVMARFQGRALAAAMGGFLAAHPLALGLALATLPSLAVAFSWRGAMLASAVVCALTLVGALLTLSKYRADAMASSVPVGARPDKRNRALLNGGEFGSVLAAALAWVGYNSGAVVLNG